MNNQEKLLKQKLALAKLLPERIKYNPSGTMITPFHSGVPYPAKEGWFTMIEDGHAILDTEWLQIVQWVEEGLTDEQYDNYFEALVLMWCNSGKETTNDRDRFCVSATVEQRLAALEAAGIIKV